VKQSGKTIVFVVVWIAVLVGAWGLGLCIRRVRFQHARIASKAVAQPQASIAQPQASAEIQRPSDANEPERERAGMAGFRPDRRPMPGGEGRMPFGNLSEEERAKLRQRWENMSEEERQQEREKRRAEARQMRERWESMSEEEREKLRTEMRQRFGGRRPQDGGPGRGRRRPD